MITCRRAWLTALASALATALLLMSCGFGGAGMIMAEGVSRELPRDTPVEQTVTGLTNFGHDLYTVAADPTKNAVISPLSIGFAFGMARAGAGGLTASQLDQIFGFPASGPHAAFNDLDRQIGTVGEAPPRQPTRRTREPGQPPAPPVVAIANGLFVQDGLPVKDGFLRILAAQYGAGARLVDFPSGRAADQINAWVRTQTAQRITKLFDRLDHGPGWCWPTPSISKRTGSSRSAWIRRPTPVHPR